MLLCLAQTSTRLNVSTTPFTLANFTQSVQLVITNVNGTSAVPEGAPARRLFRTRSHKSQAQVPA